jgi:2,4-dienoyl-CoA reductase-like NADH-dependent reductase (Old Yellow Enzyme family)
MHDGFKGGFEETECIFMAKELQKAGCDAIELTGGFTSRTAFYLMRGGLPMKGMIQNAQTIAEKLTMRFFGPFLVKRYPFSPTFFFEQAKKIRKAVDLPLIYLGGVDSLKDIKKVYKARFQAVALGRPLIYDPYFPAKLQNGEVQKTGCNRCNECIVEMDRGGVRCVLNPRD